jgi:hypothetical protein
VLRDIPARAAARDWLSRILVERPGTRTVRGRVVDAAGRPLAGVRIQSGEHHWTQTSADGAYELKSLTGEERTVRARHARMRFSPEVVTVDLRRGGGEKLNFQAVE